jgi:menaquinone-dependent protoporphyrinogen oxidase
MLEMQGTKEEQTMKVLVTVATKHGSTGEIAEVIADELRTSGLEVDLLAANVVPDIAEYDAVVLGSAVYTGGWLPAARRFAHANREALRRLPVWLFSSGPIGADEPKPLGDPAEIPELVEVTQAREHRVFAGKLDKRSLGLAERLVTRVVEAPEGDFRDWEAVRDWSRGIALSLSRTEAYTTEGGDR